MSKKLNEAAMQSELSGSAFFAGRPEAADGTKQAGSGPTAQEPTPFLHDGSMPPRHHATTTPAGSSERTRIETVRKAVRQLGKEDATYRFTREEKKALADIVYTYASSGIKTSQNEITRISVNWLLDDYRENGKTSVLARVLDRLNA